MIRPCENMTPNKMTTAPTGSYQNRCSPKKTIPTMTTAIGERYATPAAVELSAASMTWKFKMYAKPVLETPSANIPATVPRPRCPRRGGATISEMKRPGIRNAAPSHLTGRLGEGCLGVIREMTACVRKGHAVTTDRTDASERPEELTGAKSFPQAEHYQHTEESQDQTEDLLTRRFLLAERDQLTTIRRTRAPSRGWATARMNYFWRR